ncbi:MAG: hypothetical protein MUO58_07745 [Anaerolineales bacterium]|jgi:hypothetical protein|nr:hypothetical protein [Anaerolineales bacterium]
MGKESDPKALIAELRERRKLLVLLVSEYKDRLKFDDPRGDELDRSIEELRVLKAQIQSIDTALAEM